MIRRHQEVRFKPEWADPGDDEITFIATEDEDGGRVAVMACFGWAINPIQVVDVAMIDVDERDEDERAWGENI